MTPLDVIALIQDKKCDGTYLNGHSAIVRWLLKEQPGYSYYIESLSLESDNYSNVRVWSSYEAYQKDLTIRIDISDSAIEANVQALRQEYEESIATPHPLLLEARTLLKQNKIDFVRLYQVKKEMRRLGVKYSKKEFDLRELVNR